MAVFNGAFPVLPGKEDAARAFAEEVMGPRRSGYDELQKKGDITRETWSLQETPMGTLMLVWLEGDVERAFGAVATDQDDFTRWFRAQVLDMSGVDMTTDDSPPPEIIQDWPG